MWISHLWNSALLPLFHLIQGNQVDGSNKTIEWLTSQFPLSLFLIVVVRLSWVKRQHSRLLKEWKKKKKMLQELWNLLSLNCIWILVIIVIFTYGSPAARGQWLSTKALVEMLIVFFMVVAVVIVVVIVTLLSLVNSMGI